LFHWRSGVEIFNFGYSYITELDIIGIQYSNLLSLTKWTSPAGILPHKICQAVRRYRVAYRHLKGFLAGIQNKVQKCSKKLELIDIKETAYPNRFPRFRFPYFYIVNIVKVSNLELSWG